MARVTSPGHRRRRAGQRHAAHERQPPRRRAPGHDGAAQQIAARLRDPVADQPLGDDDGEDRDGDDAARVEQELHGGEELGVEGEEDARGRR